MGFKKEGAYAGIEDHVPSRRLPPPPLGQHAAEVVRAIRFTTRAGKDCTVTELKIVLSEDAPGAVGNTYSTGMFLDPRYASYYLGDVRAFVAAALGKDITDVDADTAEKAINHRDDSQPGSATGKVVGIHVTANEDQPEHPRVTFVSLT